MKRLMFGIAVSLLVAYPVCAQKMGHDVSVPDMVTPQKGYEVVSTDTSERIATQQQAMADIKERLTTIDTSITSIQSDIRVLQNTNVIVNFLLGCIKFLVPGLIIAAFGIWFAKFLATPKPRKPRAA